MIEVDLVYREWDLYGESNTLTVWRFKGWVFG